MKEGNAAIPAVAIREEEMVKLLAAMEEESPQDVVKHIEGHGGSWKHPEYDGAMMKAIITVGWLVCVMELGI